MFVNEAVVNHHVDEAFKNNGIISGQSVDTECLKKAISEAIFWSINSLDVGYLSQEVNKSLAFEAKQQRMAKGIRD